MKKLISVFMLFTIVTALFSSCYSYTNDKRITEAYKNCEHEWKEATCTSDEVCTKCNMIRTRALGHTTDSGQCTRCGEWFGYWKIAYYVDEFGDKTNEKYVRADLSGTFSNTATNGSKLNVSFLIDSDSFDIKLFEYGDNLVKNSYSRSEKYVVKVKADDGETITLSANMWSGNDRITFDRTSENQIMNIMKTAKQIKFFVYPSNWTTTKYNFTVKTGNFPDLIGQVR